MNVNQMLNSEKHGKTRLPDVYGLALDPKGFNYTEEKPVVEEVTVKEKPKNFYTLNPKPSPVYDEEEVKMALREPCDSSCKNLVLSHMKGKWGWEPKFGISEAPRTIALLLEGEPGGRDADADADIEKESEKRSKGDIEKAPESENPKKGKGKSAQDPSPAFGRNLLATVPTDEGEGEILDEEKLTEEDGEEIPEELDLEEIPDEDEEDQIPDEQDLEEIPDEDEEDQIPDEQDLEEIPDEDEEDQVPDEQDLEEVPDEDEEDQVPDEQRSGGNSR
jgi:hypothetical protein